MKVLFHSFFGLVFLVFDTVRLPFSLPFGIDLNLCLFYVLFTALSRPLKESVIVAAILGIGMDSFSGAAFGLHFTVYLWVAIALAWIPGYADAENGFFVALATAAGVLVQGLYFSVAAAFMAGGRQVAAPSFGELALGAFFAAPAGWWIIGRLRKLFVKMNGRTDRTEPRVYLGDSYQDRLD